MAKRRTTIDKQPNGNVGASSGMTTKLYSESYNLTMFDVRHAIVWRSSYDCLTFVMRLFDVRHAIVWRSSCIRSTIVVRSFDDRRTIVLYIYFYTNVHELPRIIHEYLSAHVYVLCLLCYSVFYLLFTLSFIYSYSVFYLLWKNRTFTIGRLI